MLETGIMEYGRMAISTAYGKTAYGKMVILTENGNLGLKSNPEMDIKNKFSFMKKKRVITKVKEISDVIYSSSRIRISKELNGELFFEIENEVTADLSEAIAIAIQKDIKDETFWKTSFNIDINNISPDKALYWLSGGDVEWLSKNHYNINWSEVYLTYQEEFGLTIIDIILKAKNFEDIRKKFIQKLNLPILYEFALEKNIIK